VGVSVRSVPSAGQIVAPPDGELTATVTLLLDAAPGAMAVEVASTDPAVANVETAVAIQPGARAAVMSIQTGVAGSAVLRLRVGDVVRDLNVVVGVSPTGVPVVAAPIVGLSARTVPSAGVVVIGTSSGSEVVVVLLPESSEFPQAVTVTATDAAVAVGEAAVIPAGSRAAAVQIQTGQAGIATLRLRAGEIVRDLEVIVGPPASGPMPVVPAPIVGVDVQ
jgi:hypothetical protein